MNETGKMDPAASYDGFSSGRKIDSDVSAGVLAERHVVGAVLADNSRYMLVSDLHDRDFEDVVCQRIFRAIKQVLEGEIAGVTRIDAVLCTSFAAVSRFINPARLRALTDQAASISDEVLIDHASLIKRRSARRRLAEQANELHTLILNTDADDAKIQRAIRAIGDIDNATSQGDTRSLGEFSGRALEQVAQAAQHGIGPVGIPSGLPELDDITSGFHPGNVIVIAGRPGMGKTALAFRLTNGAAAHGHPVVYFSLEMAGEELAKRQLAIHANIDSQKLRNGALDEAEWTRLAQASEYLSKLPIELADATSQTLDAVNACARRAARRGKLSMLVIDYLQLMEGSNPSNRQSQIADISRGLKKLARELEIPVVILSQLNRSLELRPDKRPIMSDLRESGAIEQDADLIIFVYRDEIYNPHSLDEGIAELIIGKQRSGPTGTVRVGFNDATTSFYSLQLDKTAPNRVDCTRASNSSHTFSEQEASPHGRMQENGPDHDALSESSDSAMELLFASKPV